MARGTRAPRRANAPRKPKRDGPDWRAPGTALLALLASTLIAIGHHLFYSSLNGKPVSNFNFSVLGTTVSKQQINIAGGTAFAFLFRAAIAKIIALTYDQLIWRAKTFAATDATMKHLDTLFAGLDSFTSWARVWMWWRYPLLYALVISNW